MKIAIVTETFHPVIGGQEVRYLEIGRELVKRGHTVSVLTIRTSPNHSKSEVVNGIEVHRITDGFHYRDTPGLRRNPLDIMRFTWDLAKRRDPLETSDLLIFNIWPVLPGIVLPRMLARPSAVDWCEIRQSTFWNLMYRILSNPNVLHLALSEDIRGTLCQQYGLPCSRVRVIESGIHYAKYQCCDRDKSSRTILFLGRLASHKDPLMVLDGYNHRNLGAKGYTLHFAGDGPLLAKLRERTANSTTVHVHGAVDEETKVRLLHDASLLVLPSRREGFPRVIAEAAAAGTPTLTTVYPENGSVAVVNQYGIGWTCTPNRSDVGKAMEKYANRDAVWTATSTVCRDVARTKFDWTMVVAELIQFVEGKL